MEPQHEPFDRPVSASLKATYRALLARGLESGEAANLTAFLHGLPSAGFRWSLAEIDAIIQRRMVHAADVRAAALAAGAAGPGRSGPTRPRRPVSQERRGTASTDVIDRPSS
jgi:hypothetical protein